jgi:hypothetical protein
VQIITFVWLFLNKLNFNNISVGIVTRLRAGQYGVLFSAGRIHFPLIQQILTDTRAHPASDLMAIEGVSPPDTNIRGVKLTTHLHLDSSSRISATVTHFPVYVYVQGQIYLWLSSFLKTISCNLKGLVFTLNHPDLHINKKCINIMFF